MYSCCSSQFRGYSHTEGPEEYVRLVVPLSLNSDQTHWGFKAVEEVGRQMEPTTPPPQSAGFLRPTTSRNCTVRVFELAALPTQWDLEREDNGVLSLDFSNAIKTVNRTTILDIWAKIFPKTQPSIQTIYATPPQTFAAVPD